MSSKLILYGIEMSPPVRAVRMTLEALELDYEFKIMDVFGGELQTPEFLKKNPQHTVPTLEETDGTCMWDSHAIMAYLVRKYGKTDTLYPKDFYQRAVVDQRLHYENGVLFMSLGRLSIAPIVQGTAKKEDLPEMFKNIEEASQMLETFLGDKEYIAGDDLTIADFSIISALSPILGVASLDETKFPKLSAWIERIKELPYYEKVNAKGNEQLYALLKEKMAAFN